MSLCLTQASGSCGTVGQSGELPRLSESTGKLLLTTLSAHPMLKMTKLPQEAASSIRQTLEASASR